jgi:hypothetical protein
MATNSITNVMLKQLPMVTVKRPMLPHQLLAFGTFPSRWKTATVVMLSKTPRPASTPSKYRPINLLSAVGKVAEAVILHPLKAFVDASHPLPEFQFGFRQGRSTIQQLLRVAKRTTLAFNLKKVTGAFFLNIEKAFERVWHKGFLYKLRALAFLLLFLT